LELLVNTCCSCCTQWHKFSACTWFEGEHLSTHIICQLACACRLAQAPLVLLLLVCLHMNMTTQWLS
jgi:hypothetical protein